MRLRLTLQGQTLQLDISEKRVFVPNLVGLLNAAAMTVRPGDTVFDAGTGSGVHAILAARLGARRVIGCDVNGFAVRAARRNARLNGVADRCEFLHASFDEALARVPAPTLVVSALPNTPAGHAATRERAMREAPLVSRHLLGGVGGASLNARLISAAAARLAPLGRLHFHTVEWNDNAPMRAALRKAGFSARVVAHGHVPRWGQRCNAVSTYERRASRAPWLLRYAELPAARGTGVDVITTDTSPSPRLTRPEVLVEMVPARA